MNKLFELMKMQKFEISDVVLHASTYAKFNEDLNLYELRIDEISFFVHSSPTPFAYSTLNCLNLIGKNIGDFFIKEYEGKILGEDYKKFLGDSEPISNDYSVYSISLEDLLMGNCGSIEKNNDSCLINVSAIFSESIDNREELYCFFKNVIIEAAKSKTFKNKFNNAKLISLEFDLE